ncbi:hypothetical protein ACHAW6_009903 [Cyclotella cf. meneghiniana]
MRSASQMGIPNNWLRTSLLRRCMTSIIGFNTNATVSCHEQFKVVDEKKIVACSTKGWEMCCACKDGSTSWHKLSDLKESHHVQVAEFAIAAGIADELAFNYASYHKHAHKFWIERPKSVDEAYAIDATTGTSCWRDATEKEDVCVAFDVFQDGTAPPPDHWYVRCHMIFHVKMEDFYRKAQLVAGVTYDQNPCNTHLCQHGV